MIAENLPFKTILGSTPLCLNSDGLAWLDRTGNGLVHETTKMIPKLVFLEEKKHLKSVPALSELLISKTAIVRKNNIVM